MNLLKQEASKRLSEFMWCRTNQKKVFCILESESQRKYLYMRFRVNIMTDVSKRSVDSNMMFPFIFFVSKILETSVNMLFKHRPSCFQFPMHVNTRSQQNDSVTCEVGSSKQHLNAALVQEWNQMDVKLIYYVNLFKKKTAYLWCLLTPNQPGHKYYN